MEKPDSKFIDKEDGQVTRMTYPNDKNIGSKLKIGYRVWLYYLSNDKCLAKRVFRKIAAFVEKFKGVGGRI